MGTHVKHVGPQKIGATLILEKLKVTVTPQFFFLLMIIIIYSSTKQLILKYSISALKNLNVEFLLEFVQKEDMENLL